MDQTFFIEVLLFILETKFCQDFRFVVFIVRLALARMILVVFNVCRSRIGFYYFESISSPFGLFAVVIEPNGIVLLV